MLALCWHFPAKLKTMKPQTQNEQFAQNLAVYLSNSEGLTIYRNLNGSLTISDIIRGQRIVKTYYDYTIKEAKRLFNQYKKTL